MQFSKRSRLNFIELAADGSLRDIRRFFESEGFEPLPPGAVEEQGERRTLAARYDGAIDTANEEQASRLLRVYVDAIASWGQSNDELSGAASALVASLQEDGAPVDDSGKLVRTKERAGAQRRHEVPGDKLFVSHAAVDVDLAEALVELLRLGTDLPSSDIFLSSLPETGVPAGRDFVDHIREELTGAALILQLITPAFFESAFCLCELGAQWGIGLRCYPLLVPPIDHSDLDGVLGQIQAPKIDDSGGLDGLYDRVRQLFALDPATAGWTKQRDRFLIRLDELLDELAQPHKVDRRLYEQVLTDLEAAREQGDRLRAEVGDLNEKVERLAKAKDPETVAEILADEDVERDFDRLVDDAKEQLRSLSSIVVEALFHEIADLVFVPSPSDQDEVEREVANGFLERHEWEEHRVDVNRRDPAIRRALTVLRQLSDFVPDKGLERKFEHEHDLAFDFTNRRMWEELGLLGGWLPRPRR